MAAFGAELLRHACALFPSDPKLAYVAMRTAAASGATRAAPASAGGGSSAAAIAAAAAACRPVAKALLRRRPHDLPLYAAYARASLAAGGGAEASRVCSSAIGMAAAASLSPRGLVGLAYLSAKLELGGAGGGGDGRGGGGGAGGSGGGDAAAALRTLAAVWAPEASALPPSQPVPPPLLLRARRSLSEEVDGLLRPEAGSPPLPSLSAESRHVVSACALLELLTSGVESAAAVFERVLAALEAGGAPPGGATWGGGAAPRLAGAGSLEHEALLEQRAVACSIVRGVSSRRRAVNRRCSRSTSGSRRATRRASPRRPAAAADCSSGPCSPSPPTPPSLAPLPRSARRHTRGSASAPCSRRRARAARAASSSGWARSAPHPGAGGEGDRRPPHRPAREQVLVELGTEAAELADADVAELVPGFLAAGSGGQQAAPSQSAPGRASRERRARSLLEEALTPARCGACAALWRLYIRLELAAGRGDAACRVQLRAVQQCPGHKGLWLAVLSPPLLWHAPERQLRDTVTLLAEKELRLCSELPDMGEPGEGLVKGGRGEPQLPGGRADSPTKRQLEAGSGSGSCSKEGDDDHDD